VIYLAWPICLAVQTKKNKKIYRPINFPKITKLSNEIQVEPIRIALQFSCLIVVVSFPTLWLFVASKI
jgi:hypothetical protein